jgi:cytochrome c oxidase subunit I+III
MGMPRRVYTYPAALGWGDLNLLASLGALLIAAAVTLFVIDAIRAYRGGEIAAPDPWGAGTLEWATSSPPPHANFPDLPTVNGREPVWDNAPDQPVVVGLRIDERDVLVTHVLDAEPDHRTRFPSPSIWPLLTALATTVLFIWSIFTPWGVVYGALPLAVTGAGWFWPKSPTEAGTKPWPSSRSLPKPHEAPGGLA